MKEQYYLINILKEAYFRKISRFLGSENFFLKNMQKGVFLCQKSNARNENSRKRFLDLQTCEKNWFLCYFCHNNQFFLFLKVTEAPKISGNARNRFLASKNPFLCFLEKNFRRFRYLDFWSRKIFFLKNMQKGVFRCQESIASTPGDFRSFFDLQNVKKLVFMAKNSLKITFFTCLKVKEAFS